MKYIPPPLGDGEILTNHRYIGTIPYVQNDRPPALYIRRRPDMIKNLMLHFKIVISGEGAAAIVNDAPFDILRRITLQGLKGETLKDVTGRQLSILNMFEFGTSSYNTMPLALEIATSYTMSADLIIPLENHTGIDPEETILNTNEFTEMLLELTWGDAFDMYDDSFALDSFEVEVYSLERRKINTDDELHPRKKLMDFDQVLPIESTQMQRRLPENTLLKTIQLIIFDTDADNIRVDDVLEYVRIVDDDNANIYRALSGREIQSFNKSYYGIEAGVAANRYQGTGSYVIEFDTLHDLSSLYNTTGKLFPKLILDFNPDPNVYMFKNVGIFIRHVGTPPVILKV